MTMRLVCIALTLACTNAAAAPALLTLGDAQRTDWGAPRADWEVAASTPATAVLTWPKFLHDVLADNLDYAAARYDVDIAAADAAAARLLPNPQLSLGGDRDLTFHDAHGLGSDGRPALLRQVESRSLGIGETIETAGKRRWRSRVADQNLRAAAATLDDFLRNLKLDAAAAYVDALAAQDAVARLGGSAAFLAELRGAQEKRLAAGDIGKPDLTQAVLEEAQFRNALRKAEADAESARLALATFLGRDSGRTDFRVTGSLERAAPAHDLDAAIADALKSRPDLIALRHTRDAAESAIELAKAGRVPDVDLNLGYAHNGGVALNHPIDPTPSFNQLTLGVTIALPLFDSGQQQVRKAFAASAQAQDRLAAAERNAEVAIRTAQAQYRSAQQRLATFRTGILQAADALVEAKRFGYRRGATTLLELLDAQRSANQVRQDYAQALADVAKARIEFDRAAGLDRELVFDE